MQGGIWRPAVEVPALEELVKRSGAERAERLPECVVFEHWHFEGDSWRTNLGWSYVGDAWNNRISSLIVVSGTWLFCELTDFGGWGKELGPGYVWFVPDAGIPDDQISSFKPIRY